jgi:secondary thiamine-phosphate synthase enzyme
VRSSVVRVTTGRTPGVVDLTPYVAEFVAGAGDGLVNVWVPHATCGIAVVEVGAGSERDLLTALDAVLPRDGRWAHRHGSAGHGRDRVLPAFVAPSVVVPVLGGRLALGTWQSLVLVDTNVDNPERDVRLSFLSDDLSDDPAG